MKKNLSAIFIILLTVIGASKAFTQTPGIQWQRTMGGEADDIPEFSIKTIDNGIITVSITSSVTGDVAGNHGATDIWVVKMNLQGVIAWAQTLGGSGTEIPVSYYYNTDGSIVILGTTTSNNGNVSGNHGNTDIWVCKLNSDGTLAWQRCYGGSSYEQPKNIMKAADGTYIISGATFSNNGDVSGHHGNWDGWILKVDESGILQWQRSIGGSGQDGVTNIKTIQSVDGSLYTAMETWSNDGDISGNNGIIDICVIKLSNAGIIQWQKSLGGASVEYVSDLKEASSGEIYVLGSTNSVGLPGFHGINDYYSDLYLGRLNSSGAILFQRCYGGTLDDQPYDIVSIGVDGSCVLSAFVNNGGGDVIGYHGSSQGPDIWVLQVEINGSIQWQKSLGGFIHDGLKGGLDHVFNGGASGGVIRTIDGGFLLTAYTESDNGDVSGYHPVLDPFDSTRADIWVVKLSSSGAIEWQKPLGGGRGDWPRGLPVEIAANDYIITGYTNSSEGDITANHGVRDTWIVRLGSINRIKGVVFIDQNANGVKDAAEPYFSGLKVQSEKLNFVRTAVPSNGYFELDVDTGDYHTSVLLNEPYYTPVPLDHLSSFTTYLNVDSFSIALQPLPAKQDLKIDLLPLGPARPGFDLQYKILYKNAGTSTINNASIRFIKSAKLNLIGTIPAYTSIDADTLTWNYSVLNTQDTGSIILNLKVAVPPATNNGDTLKSYAVINPVAGDLTPSDDTSRLKQVVVGSYDPNDKTEANAGVITPAQVSGGEYLHYLIRFQNTGTDTAFNVIVRDTLDAKLDWNSLQMISSSHAHQLTIKDNDKLTWEFTNINLPDSFVNEPGSHGYIAYRIKPKNTVLPGDVIKNTAGIYFDFNLPVATDIQTTTVFLAAALPVTITSLDAVLQNDGKVLVKWKTADEQNVELYEVQRSTDGIDFSYLGAVKSRAGSSNTYFLADGSALQGVNYYRLKSIDRDGKNTISSIVSVNVSGNNLLGVNIYPNPANGQFVIKLDGRPAGDLHIRINDLQGRILFKKKLGAVNANNTVSIPLNLNTLKRGVYLVQINQGKNVSVQKLIIQ